MCLAESPASNTVCRPSPRPRFRLGTVDYDELIDAAQEAELLHTDGHPAQVVALVDEPPMFFKCDVVYFSHGGPL